MKSRTFYIAYCLFLVGASFYLVSCVTPRPSAVFHQVGHDYWAPI